MRPQWCLSNTGQHRLVPWRPASFLRSIHGSPRPSRSQDPTPSKESEDYYSLLLSSPLPTSSPSASQPKPSSPLDQELREQHEGSNKASDVRVVFGSRLAGPAEARDRPQWATEKPKEPDNCCMSGCVHCVWDLYREEMEEWAARQKGRYSAIGRATENRKRDTSTEAVGADDAAVGDLDGMGGGFDDIDDVSQEGLFESVPIGIRQFMNTEKRLRERKERKSREKA